MRSPSARSATIEPILPHPTMPSVLPVISTPMKRFFSHLPAWVDASACGISRASASIRVIACSAVVIELPNGVFITMMPLAGAADHFQPCRLLDDLGRGLGGRTDRKAIVMADDLGEFFLVLAEIGLEIHLDAAVFEDLHRGRRQRIGNENFRFFHDSILKAEFTSATETLSPCGRGWRNRAKQD